MFDKISNVNENENNSGELTDKYPYLGQKKIIEGQPNEYDVICRNASVLAYVPPVANDICRSAVPAPKYLPERRFIAFRHHYTHAGDLPCY